MPYNTRRSNKRGRKQKAETKPKPGKIPIRTQTKRGRKRGRKRKTDTKPPPPPPPPPVVDPSTSTTPAPVPSTSDDYEYKYSSILPYLTVAANRGENMFSRAYVKPTASLSECLFAEEDKSDVEIEATEPESVDIRCSENASTDLLSLNTTTSFEESINNYLKPAPDVKEEASGIKEEMSQEEDNKETMSQEEDNKETMSQEEDNKETMSQEEDNKETMSQEEDNKEKMNQEEDNKEKMNQEEDNKEKMSQEEDNKEKMSQEEDNKEKMSQKEDKEKAGEGTSKTLARSSTMKDENPAKKPRLEKSVKLPVPPCIPMTENEEAVRMRDLERRITEGEDVSIADIRLYRKMKTRPVEKEKNMPAFDPHVNYQSFWAMIHTNSRVSLDRYFYDTFLYSRFDYLNSFRTRVLGSKEQYFCFLSPYTKRILTPFIFRDYEATPLWLRMMDELQRKANKQDPTWEPPPRASIDYCYVRPHHLPAMNSLAELYFWPGINLADCLRCPDFSCVVFYKKLLIGFTIAFPDLFRNNVYIPFMVVRKEWQCSGIGNLMLYHVIESSRGRSLTLHVSPMNPALILYQRFGFKVICFERNFYSRYLPPDSKKCKHAVYMRTERFLNN